MYTNCMLFESYGLAGVSLTEVIASSITVVIGTTLNFFLDARINRWAIYPSLFISCRFGVAWASRIILISNSALKSFDVFPPRIVAFDPYCRHITADKWLQTNASRNPDDIASDLLIMYTAASPTYHLFPWIQSPVDRFHGYVHSCIELWSTKHLNYSIVEKPRSATHDILYHDRKDSWACLPLLDWSDNQLNQISAAGLRSSSQAWDASYLLL